VIRLRCDAYLPTTIRQTTPRLAVEAEANDTRAQLHITSILQRSGPGVVIVATPVSRVDGPIVSPNDSRLNLAIILARDGEMTPAA
jgi:hypothetical protein